VTIEYHKLSPENYILNTEFEYHIYSRILKDFA